MKNLLDFIIANIYINFLDLLKEVKDIAVWLWATYDSYCDEWEMSKGEMLYFMFYRIVQVIALIVVIIFLK